MNCRSQRHRNKTRGLSVAPLVLFVLADMANESDQRFEGIQVLVVPTPSGVIEGGFDIGDRQTAVAVMGLVHEPLPFRQRRCIPMGHDGGLLA